MTTPTAWKPSEAQVKFVRELFAERVPTNHPNREQWWNNIRACSSNASLQTVVSQLKQMPVVRPVYVAPARPQVLTEEGYYRNPEDGTLYHLRRVSDGLRFRVYSKKGGPRRLSVEGNLVKGKWVAKGGWDSRRLQRTVKPEWKIDQDGLVEFAYGFCPYHFGPLSDGVSVALGYGPVCAASNGLEWSEEAARKVLAEQGIDADKFLAEHAGEATG